MVKVRPIGFGGTEALKAGLSMGGLAQRGRLSHGNGFGFARFSDGKFGDDRYQGGIYQKRRLGYNQFTGPPPPNSGHYFVKMKRYRPSNPRTELQQANRNKFADAMASWAGLSAEEKLAWKKQASKSNRRAFNLYVSEYMLL